MASSLEKLGRLTEAAEALREAIKLKPTFTFALVHLGSLLIEVGKPDEAVEPLRKAIEVEPRNEFAHHALGIAYIRLANKDGAMQQYYLLQDLNPGLAAKLLAAIPN